MTSCKLPVIDVGKSPTLNSDNPLAATGGRAQLATAGQSHALMAATVAEFCLRGRPG